MRQETSYHLSGLAERVWLAGSSPRKVVVFEIMKGANREAREAQNGALRVESGWVLFSPHQ